MNEISGDTTELLEAAVPAAEFTDELSDEALDRAAAVGGSAGGNYCCSATASSGCR